MDTYGDVTPEKLSDYEDKVKAMVYDPSMPIDNVFNAVQELCDFSEQAQTPYTQAQAVNMLSFYVLEHLLNLSKDGTGKLELNAKIGSISRIIFVMLIKNYVLHEVQL